MNRFSWGITGGLVAVAFIIGVGTGYFYTPEYSLSMYERDDMSLGQADRWVDLRYINAMIAHHRGAILLAKQAEQSGRGEIADLARDIQKNEPALIAELYAWKKEWYGDIRPVIDPIVPRLGEVDTTFDLRFLNALIAHHESGIEMTKEIRTKSSRSSVLDNADAVQEFLTTSGEMLRTWRSTWYSV